MYEDLLGITISLDEMNLSDLLRKQASITRQFPQFYDRVKAVGRMGGVRMERQSPGIWQFKIHSGTKSDTWYDFYMHFTNIETVLRFAINNLKNWVGDKSRADMSKLAREVIYHAEIQTFCSCPADLYWAHQYTRSKSQYHAKFTKPEHRKPTRNNKKEFGAFCKHTQLMIDLLPMYSGTMARYLTRYYDKEIKAQEAKVKQQLNRERPEREPVSAGTGEQDRTDRERSNDGR